MASKRRYIFVMGGVMSGVGKGVATASIGKILQSKGFSVSAVKIDPYVNVDAGTMNPLEHGEVFVTDDGTECDQDVGNYERFLDRSFGEENYMTTGKVYESVIHKERNLEYQGKCVEVVPHIPEEVISRVKLAGAKDKADFVLVEIGGTVGEYQNALFIEAARMLKSKEPGNVLFVLVTYLPVPKMIGEMKTKPTQNAVRTLNASGIQPDIILARSEFPVDKPRKEKIATFCNVELQDVISAPDVESIYDIPLNFEQDGLGERILGSFGVKARQKDLKGWRAFVQKTKTAAKPVKIAIVGKYFATGDFTLMDSYISVIEAVKHASWNNGRRAEITWLAAQDKADLSSFDGVIVPGGFGDRGAEGKIRAIRFCREKGVPFLGLCLGMQLALVEFAKNVCGIARATSREFDENAAEPVIDVMEEQKRLLKQKRYGGTMRLGAYDCKLTKGSRAFGLYKRQLVSERHRHRYELNNEYREVFEGRGMVFSGVNPQRDLAEIMELPDHPFFMGSQFHPEFKSRPLSPHPLFDGFVKAAAKNTAGSGVTK